MIKRNWELAYETGWEDACKSVSKIVNNCQAIKINKHPGKGKWLLEKELKEEIKLLSKKFEVAK